VLLSSESGPLLYCHKSFIALSCIRAHLYPILSLSYSIPVLSPSCLIPTLSYVILVLTHPCPDWIFCNLIPRLSYPYHLSSWPFFTILSFILSVNSSWSFIFSVLPQTCPILLCPYLLYVLSHQCPIALCPTAYHPILFFYLLFGT
jgi:hypothetical protein